MAKTLKKTYLWSVKKNQKKANFKSRNAQLFIHMSI